MAPEGDLIAYLATNHKLMSEKEQLESDIAILQQQITDKQEELRGVNDSITRNRETLLALCSPTAPRKPAARALPTPSSARPQHASNTAAATRGRCRGPGRPLAAIARPTAPLEYEHKPLLEIPRRSYVLPVLTAEASSVVEFEEGWAEISCHLCGANGYSSLDALFYGTIGLKGHYNNAHSGVLVSALDVLNKCKRRYLDASEVRAIRRGTSRIKRRSGMEHGDVPDDRAAAADNNSDLVEIDPPKVKKEEREDDGDTVAAARPSEITTPERASSLFDEYGPSKHASSDSAPSPDLMNLLKNSPDARSASPLAQVNRGLILPTVRQLNSSRGEDLPQGKRKHSLIGDGFDPLALSKEASRVKNKSVKLEHDSQEDGDGLVKSMTTNQNDDIVCVERSADEES